MTYYLCNNSGTENTFTYSTGKIVLSESAGTYNIVVLLYIFLIQKKFSNSFLFAFSH